MLISQTAGCVAYILQPEHALKTTLKTPFKTASLPPPLPSTPELRALPGSHAFSFSFGLHILLGVTQIINCTHSQSNTTIVRGGTFYHNYLLYYSLLPSLSVVFQASLAELDCYCTSYNVNVKLSDERLEHCFITSPPRLCQCCCRVTPCLLVHSLTLIISSLSTPNSSNALYVS